VVLLIVGVVVVLLIIALPFAKRRDARKGHVARSLGDVSETMRAQRRQLREARRVRYRSPPDQPHRRAGRKGR
jgi:type II secretory pathway pseudopilin PulG